MRIGIDQPSGKPYHIHQLTDPGIQLFFVSAVLFHICKRFRNQLKHGKPGIQTGIRVLEYHLYMFPECFHLAFVKSQYIFSVEIHLSAVCFQKTDDGSPCGRLSAAGFSNKSQCLALVNIKAHIIHRMEQSLIYMEIFFQMIDFN